MRVRAGVDAMSYLDDESDDREDEEEEEEEYDDEEAYVPHNYHSTSTSPASSDVESSPGTTAHHLIYMRVCVCAVDDRTRSPRCVRVRSSVASGQHRGTTAREARRAAATAARQHRRGRGHLPRRHAVRAEEVRAYFAFFTFCCQCGPSALANGRA